MLSTAEVDTYSPVDARSKLNSTQIIQEQGFYVITESGNGRNGVQLVAKFVEPVYNTSPDYTPGDYALSLEHAGYSVNNSLNRDLSDGPIFLNSVVPFSEEEPDVIEFAGNIRGFHEEDKLVGWAYRSTLTQELTLGGPQQAISVEWPTLEPLRAADVAIAA